MSVDIREVLKREETHFNDGFEKGYISGRKYYKNDISMEISNVRKSIEIVEAYAPEEEKTIEILNNALRVLEVVQIKANSDKFLKKDEWYNKQDNQVHVDSCNQRGPFLSIAILADITT